MTESCERTRERFLEALYQELPAAERQSLDEHLAQCSICSDKFDSLRETLQFMNQRERPQFSGAFWHELEEGISRRIQQEKEQVEQKRATWTWAYRIAAGIILVLLGIGIDRILWHPSHPVDPGTPIVAVRSDLELQLAQFLGRSQLLLLALSNVDTLAEGAETIDLSVQKKVSRELFEEAPELVGLLRKEGHYRLAGLVGDMEKVLLQVANLDQRRGLRQVRLIQKSLRESDLLLRVNLQKLRPSLEPRNQSRTPAQVMG